jgi:hypothetical protein
MGEGKEPDIGGTMGVQVVKDHIDALHQGIDPGLNAL